MSELWAPSWCWAALCGLIGADCCCLLELFCSKSPDELFLLQFPIAAHLQPAVALRSGRGAAGRGPRSAPGRVGAVLLSPLSLLCSYSRIRGLRASWLLLAIASSLLLTE